MKRKFIATLTLATVVISSLAIPAYARGFGMGMGGYNGANYNADGTIDVEGILAQRKTYYDSLVKAGKLTQQQADDYLDYCREMLEYRAANGFGACGGSGGGCGGGFYNNSSI